MGDNITKKEIQDAKTDTLKRLRRAEGQVRGVIGMVEDEVSCPEIFTQISAARSALRNAGLSVLKRHVEFCTSKALRSGQDEGRLLIDEMMSVLNRHGI